MNTPIKQILNLGTAEITTTSGGMNADSIQDHIGADVYIAPLTVTVEIPTSYAPMLTAIPIIVIASILFAVVGMFMLRRSE